MADEAKAFQEWIDQRMKISDGGVSGEGVRHDGGFLVPLEVEVWSERPGWRAALWRLISRAIDQTAGRAALATYGNLLRLSELAYRAGCDMRVVNTAEYFGLEEGRERT